jgi:magnesium chelatase subunit D
LEQHARQSEPSPTGRVRRSTPLEPGEKPADLALDATLKRAVSRLARRGPSSQRLQITTSDLCRKRRYRPCERLIVLLVDASDSMGQGAEARMEASKGAVLALLRKAYQNRSKVALIAFGGEEARVLLPPTRSIDLARRQLERLPTGGATPFADGLCKAWRLIRTEQLKHPGLRPVLVVISDGEANVPLTDGVPAMRELAAVAERVGRERLLSVVIDVTAEQERAADMRRLAALLRASYVRVSDLKARHVLQALPGWKAADAAAGWASPGQ